MTETCESCGQVIPTGEQRIILQLVRARRAQGRTLDDVAKKVGCNRQTIWRWEGGSSSPTLDKLLAWAETLGVTLTTGGTA